jgi:hypothetical protein
MCNSWSWDRFQELHRMLSKLKFNFFLICPKVRRLLEVHRESGHPLRVGGGLGAGRGRLPAARTSRSSLDDSARLHGTWFSCRATPHCFGQLPHMLLLLLGLTFFWLLFSCPPPCQPGWPASPCTCNGLWLHSRMALFSKNTFGFFVKDQTPRPTYDTAFEIRYASESYVCMYILSSILYDGPDRVVRHSKSIFRVKPLFQLVNWRFCPIISAFSAQ